MKYLSWRWGKGLISYWKTVINFSRFFAHIFAISLLLRTLFSLWKRDLALPSSQGFDIKEWFRRHAFNFFSRIIGFFVKIITLLFWLFLEIVWWILAFVFYPIWIFSPLAILGLLFYAFNAFISLDALSFYTEWLQLIGNILMVLFLVLFEFKTWQAFRLTSMLEPNAKDPNPNDPWFISVCAHLLIDQNTLKDAWGTNKLKTILLKTHLTREEFDKIIDWEIINQVENARRRCYWLADNLMNIRPVTEEWIYGWTFILNKFSHPLEISGRNSIARINTLELEILKNSLAGGEGINVAIIGETGTGRKHLVTGLAIDLVRSKVPDNLLGKKVLEFYLDNLLASGNTEEEKIFLLEKALVEASSAGNIILFIPALDHYLNVGTDEDDIGKADISAVLTNFLENTSIQIVTVASQQEINTLFHNHPNFTKYFRLIQLEEPDPTDSFLLVCEKGKKLEFQFDKLITYTAVKKAWEISSRYLQENAMPKRALDFLEEAVNYYVNQDPKKQLLNEADIENFASIRIGSAIGSLQTGEKEKLANLEEEMKKLIIGQTEAVASVASALRRRRLDLSNPERPAGCFLFLGPTGVGKTHTAEVLAKLYFGGEDRMARLDMSEYQGEDGVIKLLGDPSGKIEGYLRKILSANPFGIILLDELEKSSTSVQQLLLQIMEEGIAKTGTGKKLNFRETIIIATSNAEALLVQDLVKKGEKYKSMYQKVVDKIQQDRIFTPELLNRFDDIIVFHSLNQDEMTKVADLALKDLKKRLAGKDILITYSDAFRDRVAKIGYDPVFGARELRRVVGKEIEDKIATDMLSGKITRSKEFELPIEYLNIES